MLFRLKRRIPDADSDRLLRDLLNEAEAFILDYTGRDYLPERLEEACVRVAAMLYNRMGMEGEGSHGEGGVNRTADMLPEDLRRWLNGQRLVRTL